MTKGKQSMKNHSKKNTNIQNNRNTSKLSQE